MKTEKNINNFNALSDSDFANRTEQMYQQMLLKTDCLEAQIKAFKGYLNNRADLEKLILQGNLIFEELCGMLDDIETHQTVADWENQDLPEFFSMPEFPSVKF